jgi:hypothetical protein
LKRAGQKIMIATTSSPITMVVHSGVKPPRK